MTARSNTGSQVKSVVASPAANIQDSHPCLKAKTVADGTLPCDGSGKFVPFVQKPQEEGGIGSMVYGGEMRNVLAGHGRIV